MGGMKGYKVTNADRSRTVGVACTSLQELIEKARIKFMISKDEIVNLQLEDGTFVDDDNYFETLPQQTLLIMLRPQENALTGAEILYNALRAVNLDFLQAGQEVNQFFSTNLKHKVRQLAHLVGDADGDDRVLLSTKTEDPVWFQGLDTRASSKEQVMFRGAQDRIRGYMFKTCDALKKSEPYKVNRKKAKHFGCYFDRSGPGDGGHGDALLRRLCDDAGTFRCQGRWDEKDCLYSSGLSTHAINPYCSREARVLFQMWNLDHRIERSRTVIPAMLEAAQQAVEEQRSVRWSYFFQLLFTHHNLKLVHIVCHDKSVHSAKCDPSQYLI
ncbi:DNA fragmentation factor subunit beta isoform X2 [Bacillus rossius redtenbacheri]|uniref:DNA fragmentation factor subunit beta isoform X2 n=1 Tax=Bacillus rossius redtenbacheri TaxID=93214 RepID=UPI002FDD2163